MKTYEEPKLEVVTFQTEDILDNSNGVTLPDEDIDG